MNVYLAPTISITTNPISLNNFTAGESFIVTAILANGYNVESQAITLAPVTPSESNITYTNNPCNVSSSNSSCNITVNVGVPSVLESYTINITNPSSGIIPNPNSIAFNVVSPSRNVFFTSTTFMGNLGGVSGADSLCMQESQARTYGGTYRAYLVDVESLTRVACISPNCIESGNAEHVNWVTYPNESYVFHFTDVYELTRSTSSYGLFEDLSGNVNNDLGEADFPDTPAQLLWYATSWTAMQADYTLAQSSCNSWTINGGIGVTTVSKTINDNTFDSAQQSFAVNTDFEGVSCNELRNIMCVQQ